MTGLADHLALGATTVCHAWALERADGVVMGFTDHDGDLAFEGIRFLAGTGLTAGALQQVTGLAVDNAEVAGALSDAGIREADIRAGRFDGAEVRLWLVNWADVGQRMLRFRGSLGEVVQQDGAFRAELRGLTEALNRPMGRIIQPGCDAVLGDARCRVDLTGPDWHAEVMVEALREGRILATSPVSRAEGWFRRGTATFLDGAAAGVSLTIKSDRRVDGRLEVELWQEPGVAPAVGDRVRLVAGCDRRDETCRGKFRNFMNFRGFPHVPDEDWITAWPARVVRGG
ncbi:MAG: hypothetical protein RL216_695 [Pseudomonadota bacterium]|jgi:uncharacterized phage protein (TIGR02218 family)